MAVGLQTGGRSTIDITESYTECSFTSSCVTVTYFNNSDNITDVLFDTNAVHLKEITKWIWRIIAPIIFIVGVFGNLGIIFVLCRMKQWKKITYNFLFIHSISDTTVLITGLTRRWILATFDLDIRTISDFGCKLDVFMIYFSMHISSWILVSITVDRFVKTRFPLHYRSATFSSLLKIILLVPIVLSFFIDGHLIITNGLMKVQNEYVCNNTSSESYNYEEKYYVFIDLVWLSLLPFMLMFMMNIFIGDSLRSSGRYHESFMHHKDYKKRNKRSSKSLTRMLFFTSIYFLITTFPISIFFVVDSFTTSKNILKSAQLGLSESILYLIQFTNYGINFYFYVNVNATFKKNLPAICNRNIIRRRTSTQQNSSISTRTTQADVPTSVQNDNVHTSEVSIGWQESDQHVRNMRHSPQILDISLLPVPSLRDNINSLSEQDTFHIAGKEETFKQDEL
ncbi:galanin receptor type 2-like isoform X3 [Mytilus californianus]|uniref:galanin receptor type 2-like isoform X3 n=1 Tax=Mytilus californianus TaxID=6549 RepID=UPI0022460F4B|nr:galanin receptor type 2-like isoform X3 [Mytilus californianus]